MTQTRIACWKAGSCKAIGRILAVVMACVFFAILLELGTLIGAPLLTPLNLEHWRFKRMFIFFVVSLCVCACGLLVRDERPSDSVTPVIEQWRRLSKGGRALRLFAVIFGGMALLVLLALVASRLVGEGYDLRIPLIAVVCALAGGLLALLREQVMRKLEYGFLVLALSFGVLMCACMPVIAEVSWDGQIHFNSVNALSYVLDAEYTGADQMMVRADAVVELDLLGSGDVSAVWQPRQDADAVLAAQNSLVNLEESVATVSTVETHVLNGGSWVAPASIGYLPSAMGLWFGRLTQLSCLGQYFLGRLFSVLAYCWIFFCAIRRLRSGKSIVAALGLLPTPMLMAANFSYDPWCFAWITYAFARYVGVLQSGGVFRRCDATAIFGAFFLGALVKAVVFPLLLVFFVAPKRFFASARSERLFRMGAVLTVLTLLASFAVPFVSSGAEGGDMRGGDDVSSAGQVAYILSDPLGYLGILGRFAVGFFNPLNFTPASDTLPNALSAFPYLMDPGALASRIISVIEWALVIISVVQDRGEEDSAYRGWSMKTASAVGFASAFSLIATALYVSFTSVGLKTIVGVQHRYLLPLLACAALVFFNFKNGLVRARRGVYSIGFLGAEWVALVVVVYSMFVLAF